MAFGTLKDVGFESVTSEIVRICLANFFEDFQLLVSTSCNVREKITQSFLRIEKGLKGARISFATKGKGRFLDRFSSGIYVFSRYIGWDFV
jgi:hypothetical protein